MRTFRYAFGGDSVSTVGKYSLGLPIACKFERLEIKYRFHIPKSFVIRFHIEGRRGTH